MGLAGMAVNPDGSSQSTLAMMERNEDVLRKNPRAGLELLSDPHQGRPGRGRSKASEPYRLSGSFSNLERAHEGSILFFRQPDLPPGAYMLEAAIVDHMASTAGARFVPFTVFGPSARGLLLSSLVLVQRTEQAGTLKLEETNPLVTGDMLVYPRLGDPYRKSAASAISFFVRLKLPKEMANPAASLVLLRNGQPAATLPLPLQARDQNGMIDRVAQLPLEALPVGDFTLRLIVRCGGDEVAREVPVTVVE